MTTALILWGIALIVAIVWSAISAPRSTGGVRVAATILLHLPGVAISCALTLTALLVVVVVVAPVLAGMWSTYAMSESFRMAKSVGRVA